MCASMASADVSGLERQSPDSLTIFIRSTTASPRTPPWRTRRAAGQGPSLCRTEAMGWSAPRPWCLRRRRRYLLPHLGSAKWPRPQEQVDREPILQNAVRSVGTTLSSQTCVAASLNASHSLEPLCADWHRRVWLGAAARAPALRRP